MAASTKRTTREHRVWAHRYGPVAALSSTEQAALGIRYDEEDDGACETFTLRLAPGKAEALDQQGGIARAVAASSTGTIFVLDAAGVINVAGRRHKLADPRAIIDAPPSFGGPLFDGGVVVAGDDRLWLFSADGAHVTPGPQVRANKLASSHAGLLVAAADSRLFLYEAANEEPREVPVEAEGHLATLSLDDDARIAATSGHAVFSGDPSLIRKEATAPFDLSCVARFRGTTWVSSKAHGLFYVEDGRLMPKKPSLRAHTLLARHGVLVAASDLFVATSDDGLDFFTRDLAPFVRIAETRWPRFLQPEDPVSV